MIMIAITIKDNAILLHVEGETDFIESDGIHVSDYVSCVSESMHTYGPGYIASVITHLFLCMPAGS